MKKLTVLSLVLALAAVFAVSYAWAVKNNNDFQNMAAGLEDSLQQTKTGASNYFSITSVDNNLTFMNTLIVKDKLTGCEYLFANKGYAGGLTIRLNSKGQPIGCKG